MNWTPIIRIRQYRVLALSWNVETISTESRGEIDAPPSAMHLSSREYGEDIVHKCVEVSFQIM